MRIAVDGRSLLAGRGVARVTRSILAELPAAADADGDEIVAVVPGRAPLAVDAPAGVHVVRTAVGSRALHAPAAVAGRPRLDRLAGGADVVWLPAPAPVAVSPGVPVVLTVHDRSWELRPADFTSYERLWHRLARPRWLARRAARVTTDSAWVAADIACAWGLQGDRVTVVRPGPGLAPLRDAPAPPPPGARPYLLSVGALEPRKAPDVLARGYALARARGLDADLAVAGDGRLAAPLRGLDGVRLLGAVPDAALDALYADALALVHPALLEGFGLPPLAAAALAAWAAAAAAPGRPGRGGGSGRPPLEPALRGVPSVASDLPPLRETLGDAALFVAPGDSAALAGALVRIAGDAALRDA